jgi:hypothetical protein
MEADAPEKIFIAIDEPLGVMPRWTCYSGVPQLPRKPTPIENEPPKCLVTSTIADEKQSANFLLSRLARQLIGPRRLR